VCEYYNTKKTGKLAKKKLSRVVQI
jgi:hypothetical protein